MLRLNSAVLVLSASIAGCAGQASWQGGGVRRDFAALTADVVPPYAGLAQPEYRVVNSREKWQELWQELEPQTSRQQRQASRNPPPDIDFQQSVLIIASMGRRPTGGYSVTISSIVETPQRIVVSVAEQSPGPNCVTTQAITHPIAIVTTAQTQKPFEFEFVRTTQQCT